jgi:hypothetical protein
VRRSVAEARFGIDGGAMSEEQRRAKVSGSQQNEKKVREEADARNMQSMRPP